MKKILSVLIAVLLCSCSCFIGVSAKEELPVAETTAVADEAIVVETQPSGTQFSRGNTFTVDFRLTANDGFNTLGIKVGYDADVLEVVCPKHVDGKNCTGTRNPVSNQLSMSPDGATNNGANSKTHDVNPYVMQWAFGIAEEDVVDNELLGTLTFKVKDTAALGKTTINLVVDQASSIDTGTYSYSELKGISADIHVVCTNHEYDNNCDAYCNVCDAERVVNHIYDNGCDEDCNSCGNIRTVPGHNYTDDYDASCNECGFTRPLVAVSGQGGEIQLGSTFEMPISLTHNTGFVTLGLKIAYDEDVLEIVCPKHVDGKNCTGTRCPVADRLGAIDDASNFGQISQFHTVNPYVMQWAYGTIEQDVQYLGTLGVLTFRVKDGVKPGITTNVDILVTQSATFDGEKHFAVNDSVELSVVCKEHTYSDWNVVSKATPYATGLKSRTCTLCGSVSEEVIPQVATPTGEELHFDEIEVTTDTIVFNKIEGVEYSINMGKTWQSSNVFSGLTDDTSYVIFVRYAETELCENSEEFRITVVTLPLYTPGDVDDNGVINLRDIATLAQCLAEWDVAYNHHALDVNGDGSINLNDVTHLAQYLAGWQNIELH